MFIYFNDDTRKAKWFFVLIADCILFMFWLSTSVRWGPVGHSGRWLEAKRRFITITDLTLGARSLHTTSDKGRVAPGVVGLGLVFV